MEKKIIYIGLDNAGKTAILYMLKMKEFITTVKTIGFNVEQMEHNKVTLVMFDISGSPNFRPLWRHYYDNVEGIIFVIDSTDTDRLSEARDELAKLLKAEDLKDTVVLIYGNKQELPGALSVDELKLRIDTEHLLADRVWNIVGCSAATGDGLQEGLDWLTTKLPPGQK